jgi:major membrane immunogen (membrane-anchored lipoprotein)
MANVQQVKAVIAGGNNEADSAVSGARAAATALDRMISQYQTAAVGTQHPKLMEAITRANEAKQKLAEAANLVQAATKAAQDYTAMLG